MFCASPRKFLRGRNPAARGFPPPWPNDSTEWALRPICGFICTCSPMSPFCAITQIPPILSPLAQWPRKVGVALPLRIRFPALSFAHWPRCAGLFLALLNSAFFSSDRCDKSRTTCFLVRGLSSVVGPGGGAACPRLRVSRKLRIRPAQIRNLQQKTLKFACDFLVIPPSI